MNIHEIEQNGMIETDPTTAAQEERPAVTDEEFKELAGLQNRQIVIKSQILDVTDFIASARAQIEEFVRNGEAQIASAETRIQELRDALNDTTQTLRTRFAEITAQYGFEGVQMVNIAETSPHYIAPATAPAAPVEA